MIRKMLDARKNEESGFTLVELLVVILIIGILAAIAIPVFLNQRQRANDSAVESDVRNLATTIETMLISDPNATTVTSSQAGRDVTVTIERGATTVESETVTLSDGVSVSGVEENPATGGNPSTVGNGYTITAHHENGRQYQSGSPLVYDSAAGGFQD